VPRQIITSPKVITPLFFVSEFPARTTVQVAGLAPALTGDGHPFLVEIDAVAILPSHMETTSWQP
jgi:enamine deaminase RidA (YjgF/YER057c/UK114 family)